MNYAKDTDKTDHEKRIAAIIEHTRLANATQDRRLACAALRLCRALDERRKKPWTFGDDNSPEYAAAALSRPAARKINAYRIEFDASDVSYEIFRDAPDCSTELIATVPIGVFFDAVRTQTEIFTAESRAVTIATALAADELRQSSALDLKGANTK